MEVGESPQALSAIDAAQTEATHTRERQTEIDGTLYFIDFKTRRVALYRAVAVNVTEPTPPAEAVTVWAPVPDPSVHSPEVAIPFESVGGVVGKPTAPPPLATVYVTTMPWRRWPAASNTFVQRGSSSWDAAGPV
jgi:hypothetical protein